MPDTPLAFFVPTERVHLLISDCLGASCVATCVLDRTIACGAFSALAAEPRQLKRHPRLYLCDGRQADQQ
jgi:hypothetical protein